MKDIFKVNRDSDFDIPGQNGGNIELVFDEPSNNNNICLLAAWDNNQAVVVISPDNARLLAKRLIQFADAELDR
jgi:hypothetical protein